MRQRPVAPDFRFSCEMIDERMQDVALGQGGHRRNTVTTGEFLDETGKREG